MQQFTLLPAENNKVNKYLNIRRQFQNLMTCRNDMMHTLDNLTRVAHELCEERIVGEG